MTTTRSWAASTSEPATLQRRSEGRRAGGAHGLGRWSGSFSRSLGLECGTYSIWSSLWRESLRRHEARLGIGPRGAGLPIRDSRAVHPAAKAGSGNPGHRDGGENRSLGGRAEVLCAMNSSVPSCPCSVLRGELQLCRRQPTHSTRPRMSLQPRFVPFFSNNLLSSPPGLPSLSLSSLCCLIPVPRPQRIKCGSYGCSDA